MKKKGLSIAAVLLVVVLIVTVGIGSAGFKNWHVKTWFHSWGKDKVVENADDGIQEGNLLVGGFENVAGARLCSARIAPEDYEAYGISTDTESAVTVTVENIQPENATDKTIEWTYNFSGERIDPEWKTFFTDEEWQEVLAGQNDTSVSDFITVTPSEDTHSVVVECLGCFGAPITVTGTFNSNKALKLSFTCNYLAKVENAELKIQTYAFPTAVDTLEYYGDYTVSPDITFSWGTVFPEVVTQGGYTVSCTPSFLMVVPPNMRDFSPQAQTISGDLLETGDDFIHGFFTDDFSASKSLTYFNTFCGKTADRRAQGGGDDGDLGFSVTYSVTYNGEVITSGTLTKEVKFEPWEIPVSDADLSDTEILF